MLETEGDPKGLKKCKEKIRLKEEKGISKELVAIQPNFSTPENSEKKKLTNYLLVR